MVKNQKRTKVCVVYGTQTTGVEGPGRGLVWRSQVKKVGWGKAGGREVPAIGHKERGHWTERSQDKDALPGMGENEKGEGEITGSRFREDGGKLNPRGVERKPSLKVLRAA